MMGQKPDVKLTPEIAREVCQRTGSAAVLGGSIAQIGTQYLLTVKAVNCVSGKIYTRWCCIDRLSPHLFSTPIRKVGVASHQVDYFRVAGNPSRVDAKRGDHFLQAVSGVVTLSPSRWE
jgi:hypothetical protein